MRTYTPEQTAELLQVTVGTVRKLARDGRLQGAKIGNHWRFTEENIRAFLQQQTPGPRPGPRQLSDAEIMREHAL